MKKLFSLLLVLSLCGSARLFAQAVDPTRAALDNVFANVDKSQVPTGFLAEYALPLVPLDVFNGTLTDSSRTTPDGFRFIYGTIYTARIYGTNPLPTIQSYNAAVDAAEATAGAAIPIMLQRVSYAAVRPDAFSANLLSIQNGQVFDVAGRTQSPYESRTVFAAAPTRAWSATGNVSFIFPLSLAIQSGGAPVGGRYVDFGDGRGYVATYWNQPISTSYATAGTKRVKVRVSYYDGNSYESHFDLEVAAPGGGAARPTAGDYSIPFAPIAGVRAGGTAYVHLAAANTQLTKPLIVAEGYDKHSVAPLVQKNNYSIGDFLLEITTQPGFNFRNALENIGSYDIVFIDYDNGTDDLLANAGLFEAVLNRVNADKQGTEPNVVMGISMGGLIARYQLADMVKAGRPTQTRLLILQDSPQRGANVPLGIQALTRQALVTFGPFTSGDLNRTLQQANLLLDRPATQQLLLYQPTGATGGFRANTFVEGAYRSKITFPAGQQPPYQIVAVSQGSQCGNGLFAPGTELLHGDGKLFFSPFFFIVRNSYHSDVTVNALPANGASARVSLLHIYNVSRLFLGLITIQNDIVLKSYYCPSGLLPLDGAPGGTEPIADTPGNLAGNFNPVSLPFLTLSANYSAVDKFSFIPTPSALDIEDFNPASVYGKYINGVASTSYSRVNKFLAQEQFTRGSGAFFNEAHTIFTARNGEWIFNEMQRPPGSTAANGIPCSTECFSPADNAISGPATLCGNGTYTTPLRGTSGTTYTWAATPAGSFTVASGTGPIFTTANVGDANGTITLQIGGDCPLTLTRDIKVGAPEQPGLSVNIGCQDFAGTATILNYDPANTYSATTTGNVFFFSANRRSMTVTSASFNIKPEVPARWGTSICR